MAREAMHYDAVIVGGGPAGLAAAIRLRQLARRHGRDLSVCVLEKGAEIGAHILSGAVLDPRALFELFPDALAQGAPLNAPVTEDRFLFLSERGARRVPQALLPECFRNAGNFVVSLGSVCRWLGRQAEALGVELYPGFAGAELLYDDSGAVAGVATGELGLKRDGTPGPRHQPGMELYGKYTFFAEGCRGHLGQQLEARFNLRAGAQPQVHGLGIKELWEIPSQRHRSGLVIHSAGWPLDADSYGGGFLYHLEDNLLAVGLVVGLSYSNPYLSPFDEFQRFKTHPEIREFLEGGKRLSYGARALAAGGVQSLPRLVFPGGVLVGDDAGFLNAARVKGSHGAIKSGMLAAEACFEALAAGRGRDELAAYPEAYRKSWLHEELQRARNFKPWLSRGLYFGAFMFGIEQLLLRGRTPWTLRHPGPDHARLRKAAECAPIAYPKPDGVLSFDLPSSVYLSNTRHEAEQPCHLRLRDAAVPVAVNLALYAGPEARYCPAGVYEFVAAVDPAGARPAQRLQINAENCVHCKTCDIKDPTQNISWVPPQGGEGPLYARM